MKTIWKNVTQKLRFTAQNCEFVAFLSISKKCWKGVVSKPLNLRKTKGYEKKDRFGPCEYEGV